MKNPLTYFSVENRALRAMRHRRLNLLADVARVLQSEKPNLQEALRRVADRNVGRSIELSYRNILRNISSGKDNGMSSALQPYFPDREFLLIKAFDLGAKTDLERGQGFATAVSIMRPLAQLRRGFTNLMISFVFSLILVCILWLVFAPGIGSLFGDLLPRNRWYTLSRWVVDSGTFMAKWWTFLLPAVIGIILLIAWALPNWRGTTRRWFDKNVPGFKVYREYCSILSLIGLACFMKANSGLDWAFKQVLRLGTPWESDYVEAMRSRSKQYGASKMLDVGFFPDEIIDRVALREGTDSLETSLNSVALQNINELTESMQEKLATARVAISDFTKVLGGTIVIAIVLLIIASLLFLTSTTR